MKLAQLVRVDEKAAMKAGYSPPIDSSDPKRDQAMVDQTNRRRCALRKDPKIASRGISKRRFRGNVPQKKPVHLASPRI